MRLPLNLTTTAQMLQQLVVILFYRQLVYSVIQSIDRIIKIVRVLVI